MRLFTLYIPVPCSGTTRELTHWYEVVPADTAAQEDLLIHVVEVPA